MKDFSFTNQIEQTISKFGQSNIGLTTGFQTLDIVIRGLLPSQLVIVGARPSIGKTAIALNMALEASKHEPVGFISLEMPIEDLQVRALSYLTGINQHRMLLGKLSTEEKDKIDLAVKELDDRKLFMDFDRNRTIYPPDFRERYRCGSDWEIPQDSLNSRIFRLVDNGVKVILIDYIQLLRLAGKNESKRIEMGEISKLFFSWSREYKICIVLLCQLRRFEAERYADGPPRPRMDDLKETGDIEQDADVILLLHRPNFYEKDNNTDIQLFSDVVESNAEIIVEKNRNGPTQKLNVEWHGYCLSYREISPVDFWS